MLKREEKANYEAIREKEVSFVREAALTAVFTAMVFLSTAIFYVALVASSGFFNLGESFVYIAALVGGPIVGAVAGGLGSAMADMALGYGNYAPATLILKGAEGFTAGYLYQLSNRINEKFRYIMLGFLTVTLIALSIYFTTPFLNGTPGSETINGGLTLNFPNLNFSISAHDLSYEFPGMLLVIIAIVLSAVILYVGLFLGEKGQMALSCAISGIIIIVGYFLWSFYLYGFAAAASEVIFNIGQVVFGTVIAVPIVMYLRELGIIPSDEQSVIHTDEEPQSNELE